MKTIKYNTLSIRDRISLMDVLTKRKNIFVSCDDERGDL